MSLSSPTFISSPHFEECRRSGLVKFKQQERERRLHCLSFASNKTKLLLGSVPDDRSASSHDVKSSRGSIPDDRSTSCHAESSLGSILAPSSSSLVVARFGQGKTIYLRFEHKRILQVRARCALLLHGERNL